MKKLILLLPFCLLGCDDSATKRQKLVEEFGTTEVMTVPGRERFNDYVIRDTNGAIWYVWYSSDPAQKTKLFEGQK